MPELPEVETIVRDLEAVALGRRISAVFVTDAAVIREPGPEHFMERLIGRTVVAVERQAKHLLLHLSGGLLWHVHLMLEGQLLYVDEDAPVAPSTLLMVTLDNHRQLRICDVLGYARTLVLPEGEAEDLLKLRLLGPEPIHPSFTYETFLERLDGRRGKVKPLLLNQRLIAGIGSIYADEALFRARIHPERKFNTLMDAELGALFEAIVAVLNEGIAHRGTTVKGGNYRDLWGAEGHHQAHLAVFRRAGEPCPNGCRGTIEEIDVGGRPTFVCPRCQVRKPGEASGETARFNR